MNIDTHSLLEEMTTLYAKIKDGSAQMGDLEAFASAASHVNERAVILRYKAYEEKVFGVRPVAESAPEKVSEVIPEQVAEEVATTEAGIESNDPDMEIPMPADPEPIIQTENETEGFDLFSLNDEEEDEPVFEPFATEEPADEVKIPNDMPDFDEPEKVESGQPEKPIAEEKIVNPESIIEHPQVVAEEPLSAEPEKVDAPVFSTIAPQPELPADEMKPSTETSSGPVHPLYNNINASDDSLASRLLSVKLETLNGAFGFNERLQMVQELFQGNNDKFNEAISKLDNLNSKNEARQLITSYANQNNWSDRSDLVMEFVKKVERRYA